MLTDTFRSLLEQIQHTEEHGLTESAARDIRDTAVAARAIIEQHVASHSRDRRAGRLVVEWDDTELSDAMAFCTAVATMAEALRQGWIIERDDVIDAMQWLAYRAEQRWAQPVTV